MDKDIFSSDECIGEFTLDFFPIYEDAYLTDKLQTMYKGYWDTYMKGELVKRGYEGVDKIIWDTEDDKEEKFWVPISKFDTEKNKMIDTGEVLVSMRIYPKAAAEKNEQGKGREEPNNDPNLPEPEGRIQLSLNPFTMLA